jgi:hypothetical protein
VSYEDLPAARSTGKQDPSCANANHLSPYARIIYVLNDVFGLTLLDNWGKAKGRNHENCRSALQPPKLQSRSSRKKPRYPSICHRSLQDFSGLMHLPTRLRLSPGPVRHSIEDCKASYLIRTAMLYLGSASRPLSHEQVQAFHLIAGFLFRTNSSAKEYLSIIGLTEVQQAPPQ